MCGWSEQLEIEKKQSLGNKRNLGKKFFLFLRILTFGHIVEYSEGGRKEGSL